MTGELDREVYKAILESISTGVYLVDRDRKILVWNYGAERITGYLRQEVIGHSCFDNLLDHCDENDNALCGVACPLLAAMRDGEAREADVFLRHKQGHRVPVRVRSVPVRDADGVIIGAAEGFDERTSQAVTNPDPGDSAEPDLIDEATGVSGYASSRSHLCARTEAFREHHVPFAVLAIAVNQYDQFRKAHGMQGADAILRVVAQTLAKNLPPSDLVGRWSVDRFLAIVTNCPEPALARVASMLKRIVNMAAVPWWGDHLSITVSIGGTAVRADDTAGSLWSRCEEALAASSPEQHGSVTIL